ncbi:response regulator transcription factor [Paenibacillus roseipurpureus]|uniref:Response regulator n=1 Tax=Paenibacillus roseopurpureus TaxID=2918901 RepID=A0AA96LMX7_9BACL|nr:response regulator [Paenibacillus sp. MBLB1832]WNR44056.1 response regulator [Paenibacillus sp. MBLB1832]
MIQVMLVEDEAVIRGGLRKLIEEVFVGFKVSAEAETGKEALTLLKSVIPDLIITDIRMKDMDGLAMIERIREQNIEIPIVILSGYSDFEYAKRALRNRVEDYLLKPIDRGELALCLEKLRSRIRVTTDMKANLDLTDPIEERAVIRRVKELVQSRLHQEVSLQYIAEQVGMNSQYLSGLFKQETGQNFVDYVTASRMNKAKKLLKETNLKIYEIAGLSGYVNAKHFMTVFKQGVGVTPSEYREGM